MTGRQPERRITKLTPAQGKLLYDALVAAFPKKGEVDQLITLGLGEEPAFIYLHPANPGTDNFIALIKWAESSAKLEELVTVAIQMKPGQPALLAVAHALGIEGAGEPDPATAAINRIAELEQLLQRRDEEIAMLKKELAKEKRARLAAERRANEAIQAKEQAERSHTLTLDQRRQLQAALLDAFRSQDALDQMVRHGLDENRAAIAAGDNLQATIFKLIEWAESQGRLADLIAAAKEANPNNPKLRAFIAPLEGNKQI